MKRFFLLFISLQIIAGAFLYAQDSAPVKKTEPHDYLLLGFQLSPSAEGLANRWVVSEGGDFALFGPLLGGYEFGMFHRATDEKLELRFKTFFNFKLELFTDQSTGGYIGAGGGLVEMIQALPLEFGLKFLVGFQGILGLRIGPRYKDKFILELQLLQTNKDDGGLRIHLLAGTRF